MPLWDPVVPCLIPQGLANVGIILKCITETDQIETLNGLITEARIEEGL